MIVVTATGYIVSVLGPYLADSKNNDASILRHMIYHNAEELRNWLQEEDVFVVDRGFSERCPRCSGRCWDKVRDASIYETGIEAALNSWF